jgi:hypothetical protein
VNSRRLVASFVEAFIKGAQEDEGEGEVEARAPIARSSMFALLRAYGRNPRVVDFFNIYADLEDIYSSEGATEGNDLYRRFLRAMDMIDSRIESEGTRNRIESQSSEIYNWMRRLDSGNKLSAGQWRDLVRTYADLIQAVAADKDVFLRTRMLPGKLPVRWLRLQKATAKEEATEKLRKEDPDLFARLYRAEEQKREMNERIRDRIRMDGREPAVRMIMNRPVQVGFAPLTGREPIAYRKKDGEPYLKRDMLIYEPDGKTYSLEEFQEMVTESNQAQKDLRINPAKHMWFEELDKLRALSPAEVDAALPEDPAQRRTLIRTMSLTDDPTKDSALTRIYEVAEIDGEDVVVSGRFKGFRVGELINSVGRQIEGSVFYNDPDTLRTSRREIRNPDGSLDVRKGGEPYVTLNNGRLLMQVPNWKMYRSVLVQLRGGKDPDTGEMVKGLAKIIPSMKHIPTGMGPRPQFFEFDLKDFSAVQDVVGSLALSAAASTAVRDYYEDLIRAEQAAESKNLSRYSADSLGLRLPLRRHVQKALAWLDANGNKGICALDTGMGKTVTAIASIQNLVKKGVPEEEDNNGRFLYVCETKLRGNLPKEMFKFLEKDEAKRLKEMVDITSYYRFNQAREKDPNYGNDYIAIYFDEAHIRMAKRSQASYQSAVSCQCKRKVLLTASPMTKSPLQVLTLASVANNLDLNSPEGRVVERNFTLRFAETVGGRIVGLKTEDPVTARDFRVWIKRNLFFADKRDVAEEEAQLAYTGLGDTGRDLYSETELVTMPPDIEAAYRVEMSRVLEGLRELIATDYAAMPELAFERVRNRVSRPLSVLTKLSDTPGEIIPGARNPKVDRTTSLVAARIGGGRTLMWTDQAKLAEETFNRMIQDFPAQGHVLGLTDRIIYSPPTTAGLDKLVEEYELSPPKDGKLIFRPRQYRDPATGRKTAQDEWSTHVLTKILGLGNKQTAFQVATAVLTGGYAVGQNLQSFNTVIHLDRDDWSSETMKQRTARAWRAGNKQPVEEITLDLVYPDAVANDDASKTLDEIRRIIQEMDADLFKKVVLDSQVEKLGEEWLAMEKQRSQLHQVDREMALRAMSPYASQLGQQEAGA